MSRNVWKFGDHINTDCISPSKYGNITDVSILAQHCMEGIDPTFSSKVKIGDIMIAGHNFGCGSSRERAPLSIKKLGIDCIIAKSFARIFLRNSINIGLPVLVCPEAYDCTEQGDQLEINFSEGKIKNITKNIIFYFQPWPTFMQNIVSAKGLVNFYKNKIK